MRFAWQQADCNAVSYASPRRAVVEFGGHGRLNPHGVGNLPGSILSQVQEENLTRLATATWQPTAFGGHFNLWSEVDRISEAILHYRLPGALCPN